ncbi:MAG: hydrogenase iron-sulfur subunit [Terriglobia bacterium]|jgi:coenzyme F420-reducing hydrogenase delta subunit/ferredoxin
MNEAGQFEPKIVAYVCNWCTYLGADLAGTTRLEYPPNVRIIRLPCTGRIDSNLIVKAFEIGADAVLVSGCHPGDCHYTAGNYHARRRWILFRELLEALGFEMERIHFTWISAAEGRKWQQVVTEITEQTRKLGPYRSLYTDTGKGSLPIPEAVPAVDQPAGSEESLRQRCRQLLADGTVKVVIGYGTRGPVCVTKPADIGRLVWNNQCSSNLTTYLKRQEVRKLGRAAIVVKGCDERALVVLEKESQLDRKDLHVMGMACNGMGQPKCATCDVRVPRFADEVIGEAPPVPLAAPPNAALRGGAALEVLLAKPPAERMACWAREFERCVKCYACRQVCPLCYCERCIVEKNRPTVIDPSPTVKGNFAWHITRAFHLAGRCIGCDECTRACPAGIDLRLLNLSLAKAAEEHFGYRAGINRDVEPLIGAYSLQDKENFIR